VVDDFEQVWFQVVKNEPVAMYAVALLLRTCRKADVTVEPFRDVLYCIDLRTTTISTHLSKRGSSSVVPRSVGGLYSNVFMPIHIRRRNKARKLV
jgi:hypothetical protein